MPPEKVKEEKISLKTRKYTNISAIIYEYQKEILGVRYERWHAQDLSSNQVHGRSTSNVVCKSLFQNVFKVIDTRETELGATLQINFHNLTILLK